MHKTPSRSLCKNKTNVIRRLSNGISHSMPFAWFLFQKGNNVNFLPIANGARIAVVM
jgi:hypothetical protein